MYIYVSMFEEDITDFKIVLLTYTNMSISIIIYCGFTKSSHYFVPASDPDFGI